MVFYLLGMCIRNAIQFPQDELPDGWAGYSVWWNRVTGWVLS